MSRSTTFLLLLCISNPVQPQLMPQMYPHSRDALITTSSLVIGGPDSQSLKKQVTVWNNLACGPRGLCNSTNIKYECVTKMFNCAPCRCDPECVVYRDCCPDAEQWTMITNISEVNATNVPDYRCTSQAFKTGKNVKSFWYNMIRSCPDVGVSEVERQNCEYVAEDDLIGNRPVFSTHTKRTYRNSQCASCHGEIEPGHMIPWKINITCSGYVDYSRISSSADFYTEALSNEHCAINMEPPMRNVNRECVDMSDDVISQCNVTGVYHESQPGAYQLLQQACASFQQVVSTKILTDSTLPEGSFRNVFCAVCNGLSIERESTNIPPCIDSSSRALLLSAPLSALFDFNPKLLKETRVPQVNRLGCKDNEVYDWRHETCRHLVCPYAMYTRNHTCGDMMRSMAGQGYRLRVTLSPPHPIEVTSLTMFHRQFIRDHEVLNKYFDTPYATMKLKLFYYENRSSEYVKIANMTFSYSFVNGRDIPRQTADETLLDYMIEDWYYYKTESRMFMKFKKSIVPFDEDVIEVDDELDSMDWQSDGLTFVSLTVRRQYVNFYIEVYETNSSLYIWVNELMRCPSIVLNNTEYTRLGSSVYLHAMNKTLRPLEYSIRASEVSICSEFSGTYDQVVYVPANRTGTSLNTEEAYIQTVLSIVCTTVSCLGLVITIIVYFLVCSLRTLPGKCNMLLFMNLLIAQIIFQGGVRATVSHTGCVVLGMLIHYFWLAVFGWKWICAFHMFRTFTQPLRRVAKCKTLTVYCILAQGIPMLVVILYAALHAGLADDRTPGYGSKGLCFISTPLYIGIAFALPVGIVLISNGYFFAKIVITFLQKSDVDKSSCRSNLQEMLILLKMSLLLGFTWAVGFLAAAIQQSVLWYIFIVVNASPGMFVFFTYVMNKHVLLECGMVKKTQKPTIATPAIKLSGHAATARGTESVTATTTVTKCTAQGCICS